MVEGQGMIIGEGKTIVVGIKTHTIIVIPTVDNDMINDMIGVEVTMVTEVDMEVVEVVGLTTMTMVIEDVIIEVITTMAQIINKENVHEMTTTISVIGGNQKLLKCDPKNVASIIAFMF